VIARQRPFVVSDIQATADDFFHAISVGTNSTVAFLQTLQNDALGLGWIPRPIIPRKLRPKVKKKPRRVVRTDEHDRLVEPAPDEEWRLDLQLLWFTEASQTGGANLGLSNLDWTT
jgi:hypothetical protein